MLKSVFQWLDLHPDSYWILVAAASLLLAGWLGLLIRREVAGSGNPMAAPTWRDALVQWIDPGPYGDTAWDWVYLASLRLDRETESEPR